MIDLKKTEKDLFGKVANILVAFMVLALWIKTMHLFEGWLFSTELISQLFFYQYQHPQLINIYLFCIAAPIGEEVVFRHFPLQVLKSVKKPDLYWPVILMTSVIFGWLHQGHLNILIQGMIGLVCSVLYIKNNHCLLSAIALHSLWNLSILLNLFNFN